MSDLFGHGLEVIGTIWECRRALRCGAVRPHLTFTTLAGMVDQGHLPFSVPQPQTNRILNHRPSTGDPNSFLGQQTCMATAAGFETELSIVFAISQIEPRSSDKALPRVQLNLNLMRVAFNRSCQIERKGGNACNRRAGFAAFPPSSSVPMSAHI